MRKTIFFLILLSGFSIVTGAQQQWDRPMRLKSCSIDIKADMFTATTFIEMEFYNSNKKEIEGLYQFKLEAGQVITAFQLDLNGKYRDGSIEEKWKATNTYNTIVGKRIDPALLTMDYSGNYNLRIYPVPANGSRKVTMTIQQMLSPENENLVYSLPMNINDTVANLSLNISALSNNIPFTHSGLIANKAFTAFQNQFLLNWQTENIRLNKTITFSIPFSTKQLLCSKKVNDKTSFALQFHPAAAAEYDIQPKNITVFWDASASASERNINKEISFLRQFIAFHNIEQLTIIPFNHKIIDTAVFDTKKNSGNQWRQYLNTLNYDGATQLGLLDMTSMKTDMFLLFSDGKNSYGKAQPAISSSLVSCIYTSGRADITTLQKIAGTNGGRLIALNKTSMTEAITACSRGVSWLMDITSASGDLIIEQSLPKKFSTTILLNGTTSQSNDTLYLHYGNNSRINFTEKVIITDSGNCSVSSIDRISLLSNFDELIHNYSWNDIIDFGLKEKVITPYTAYIVLERTEDYIKYNISPPKELEDECKKLNYVKRDTRFERRQIDKLSEYDILNNVINSYNERIMKWNVNEKPIYFTPVDFDKNNSRTQSEEILPSVSIANNALPGNADGLISGSNALNDVVVTGYGTAIRKNLTGSVSYITGQDIFRSATSVEGVLQGRVAGVQVTRSGIPGNAGMISIRGAASLSGNRQPLFIIDGFRVTGNINDMVNPADIEYITVLKDASATAIYGSGAANGVILIETKKGRRSYRSYYNSKSYRINDLEDVEYMQKLKNVIVAEKINVYEELRKDYKNEPAFNFDVAQHFMEVGLTEPAITILMNIAENANGDTQVLTGIAYILESGKRFAEAINIYEQLIEQNSFNLINYRNLAWVFYQSGRYQNAVDILYAAIKLNTEQEEHSNVPLKTTMLYEMNAIIAIHRDKMDISAIPAVIIRPLPVDLRIVIDDNTSGHGSLNIRDPKETNSSVNSFSTKTGGMLSQNGWWQFASLSEYQLKNALPGKYKIILTYYGGYSYPGKTPSIARVCKFKNFGNANQSIEIENVMMDNQNGEIEIGEVKW